MPRGPPLMALPTQEKFSRTINPLHFEDLEPHRFEDLVRQLAYSYRTWRYLDATGRLGRDGGLDIRGVEIVTLSASQEAGLGNTIGDAGDDEANTVRGQVVGER